ncbi:MAG: DUF445 family protein, partial [Schwartzia sp.]|nr:DUF445 family protein [Schwartzia sp. (in: firmicutes)]
PRIMRSLAEFSGRDLLSRENIMKSLARQDFSDMLSLYLTERGGRERLVALTDTIFTRGMETMDMLHAAELLEPSVRHTLEEIRLDAMAQNTLASALSPETKRKILRALLPIARKIWNDDELQSMLLSSIAHLQEAYVDNQTMRATLFEMEELSKENLLNRLNQYVETWLDELEDEESDTYARISRWLDSFLLDEKQQARLVSAIRNWQKTTIEQANITERLTQGLEALRETRLLAWRREVRAWLESRIDAFISDTEERKRFNDWTLQWFDSLLSAHHAKLPEMMERQLARLSDDELVELVETRVEDDLQMIRINGAVVGSLTGMLLYLLTLAAERMWA